MASVRKVELVSESSLVAFRHGAQPRPILRNVPTAVFEAAISTYGQVVGPSSEKLADPDARHDHLACLPQSPQGTEKLGHDEGERSLMKLEKHGT